MSTIKATNIQHPSAASPNLVLASDGSVSGGAGLGGLVHLHTESFSAVSSVSIDNVFSSTYDNYLISTQYDTSGSVTLRVRFRASGTDNSTASSYVTQSLQAAGSSVSAGQTSQDYGNMAFGFGTQHNGSHVSVYGPFLAQPTALRSVSAMDYTGAIIEDTALTHNQSVSYDGLTVYLPSGTFTGSLSIYGYANS